jgi:hypothetical protein
LPAPTWRIFCWPEAWLAAPDFHSARDRRFTGSHHRSLTESILIALAGGLGGLLIADRAERLILAVAFGTTSFLPIRTTPSLAVLGFALALALVTGLLFGAAPAWLRTRTDPVEALRGASRSTSDSSSVPRKTLLVFQATLSVVLVAGAGMLTRTASPWH